MNLIRINTTAFKEEDFLLVTDLSEKQISVVIEPLINRYRANDDDWYDNDHLLNELLKVYKDYTIIMYTESNIDTLSF